MKDCLVSFSSKGREDYNKKLLTLLDSAIEYWKGDYLIYSPDHWLDEYKGIKIHKGWPKYSLTQEEMPYQFKIALIEEAYDMGYERIVWLDTSMKLNKDITPLLEEGITVFHNLGHPLYKYISDDAIKLLGISEELLKKIPQIWGGALFFNMNEITGRMAYKAITKASINGSFKEGSSVREGFVAHRHDQAVMSALLHNKCKMLPYGKIASVEHEKTKEYGDDIYIIYG